MQTDGLIYIKCESLYYEQEKPHRFKLIEPVVVQLSDGEMLIIPEGYKTDFASVPRLLWGIVMPVGRHNLAVLVHDWLYDTQDVRGRKFADQEMLRIMKYSGVSRIKRYLMYYACRLGGRSWWNRKSEYYDN